MWFAHSMQAPNVGALPLILTLNIILKNNLNKAFENLLDDLFEDIRLDISTDISVLKTLFKQEGLDEEDFKNK